MAGRQNPKREIHKRLHAVQEKLFSRFLKANEPCCCDDACEFVESGASGAQDWCYGWHIKVSYCGNLGKATSSSRLTTHKQIFQTKVNKLSAGFQKLIYGENLLDDGDALIAAHTRAPWKIGANQIFVKFTAGRPSNE